MEDVKYINNQYAVNARIALIAKTLIKWIEIIQKPDEYYIDKK